MGEIGAIEAQKVQWADPPPSLPYRLTGKPALIRVKDFYSQSQKGQKFCVKNGTFGTFDFIIENPLNLLKIIKK